MSNSFEVTTTWPGGWEPEANGPRMPLDALKALEPGPEVPQHLRDRVAEIKRQADDGGSSIVQLNFAAAGVLVQIQQARYTAAQAERQANNPVAGWTGRFRFPGRAH